MEWEELQKLVMEILSGDDQKEILPEMDLVDDLCFDSISLMELFSEIEERWGVDFTDLDDFATRFHHCGDLYEGIKELLIEKERGQ